MGNEYDSFNLMGDIIVDNQQPTSAHDTKQTVFISYVDEETGRVLSQDQREGIADQPIDYQPTDQLKKLKEQGYVLAYNGFPKNAKYAVNDDMNQVFVVVLKHARQQVSPDAVQDQDQLPNQDDYLKSYTAVVNFIDPQGNKVHKPITQTIKWSRPLVQDQVNDQLRVDSQAAWQADTKQYQTVTVPVVKGYFTDRRELPGQPAVEHNLTDTVIYRPLGKIKPVLADGTPVPKIAPVAYQNDPHDSTAVVSDEQVPQITGYKPKQETVTPSDPSADTNVIYTPLTQHVVVNFLDEDEHQLDQRRLSGLAGDKINLAEVNTVIEQLKSQGYSVKNNDLVAGTCYDGSAADDQVFTIILTKAAVDQPTEATTMQSAKQYTFTVHFIDQRGQKLLDDQIQVSNWGANGADINHYEDVQAPVISGYFTGTKAVKGQLAVPFNLSHTIIYQRLGKIIPVNDEGTVIKDAPHPQYQNDDDDPTKIIENQVVPKVTGYVPEVETINPSNWTEDTRIVYH